MKTFRTPAASLAALLLALVVAACADSAATAPAAALDPAPTASILPTGGLFSADDDSDSDDGEDSDSDGEDSDSDEDSDFEDSGSGDSGLPPDDSRGGLPPLRPALFKCETPDFGSVTQTVGPDGGVITIGPHSLRIPSGALSEPTEITADARAGQHVKVKFSPHGLRFSRRVYLKLSYAHCPTSPLSGKILYVDDALQPLEVLNGVWLSSKAVVTGIGHFSGYALAD